jgi:hypothetical protein
MPSFTRYIGIDYSGAETPNASLKGLRVYLAEGDMAPVEVLPPPSPRKYWTRRGIAEWLLERLAEDVPTLVGIDHGFSFPLRYFEVHRLKPDWSAFLDDFRRHWPTDENIYVDFVRDGTVGNGSARTGSSRWRRLTEERSGSAKSVFHFDVQGSVAKSTHAGIPWLRFIRQRPGEHVHFWPFDGWDIPVGRSAIAEVYPRLWSRGFATEGRTGDQHDAYSIAAWLKRADHDGSLASFLKPVLTPSERTVAQVEGWILGVPGLAREPVWNRDTSAFVSDLAIFDPISGFMWRSMLDRSVSQLRCFLFGFSVIPSDRYRSASTATVSAARASALASSGSNPWWALRSMSIARWRASSGVQGEP